jgi:S1-C subfamily serine protease
MRCRVRPGINLLCGLLFLALAACGVFTHSEEGIEGSVVRILNHSQTSNWNTPWESGTTQQRFGSGFIIEGGRVMTNAHVVSDARVLLLYLHGDPTPHEARVASIGHDCDLALLQPVEPGLLDGYPAMSFDGLPRLGSAVETYGFPTAGEQISRTRGVVSRIETNQYSHSGADSHLSVQTDAAINPGNSGGPVVQDGRVVGVAFQAAPDLENIGFFIPTEVIRHFLTDVADGTYDGYPDLGVATGKLENPAARRAAGLAEGDSGIRVDLVFPGSSADGYLREGDVLAEVEGHPIANDRSVALGDLRLEFSVLVDRRQSGQTVSFGVIREGRRLDIEVPLEPYPAASRYRIVHDELPRYYVYAGLVFVPLGRNVIEALGGSIQTHLMYEYLSRPMAEPERFELEPVILLRRLDHSVNADMSWHGQLVVERVNGRTIRGLSDLVEAVESNEEEFHLFEFAYFSRFAVMRREDANRAHAEILESYGVSGDRRL